MDIRVLALGISEDVAHKLTGSLGIRVSAACNLAQVRQMLVLEDFHAVVVDADGCRVPVVAAVEILGLTSVTTLIVVRCSQPVSIEQDLAGMGVRTTVSWQGCADLLRNSGHWRDWP